VYGDKERKNVLAKSVLGAEKSAVHSGANSRKKISEGQRNFAHMVSTNYSQYKM
jgi:hypothetical protein